MNKSFIIHLTLTIGYCVAIFIQSSFPTPETLPTFPFSDKMMHFGAYGLLAILFFRTFEHLPSKKISIKTIIMVSAMASTVYGISDEIHQHFVPYRTADIMDGMFDGLGSILGAWMYPYIMHKLRRET